MSQGLREYPQYRPSPLEWVTAIPTEWEIRFLGNCSRSIQTGPFGTQLHSADYVHDGIPVINPSNILNGKVMPDWRNTVANRKADQLARHRFQRGDLVFGRRGEMGRCALISTEEEGWLCGTGCLLVRLNHRRLLPSFATLLLTQSGVRDKLVLESVGATMDNLNTRILAKLKIPCPPISDQISIVSFLNRETAKIDRLTEVRRKQIDQLHKHRAAVIHHSVTKGIDGETPIFDSGVEWLGETGVRWNPYRIKYLAEVVGGGTPKSSEFDYWDGDIVWLTPTDLGKGNSRHIEGSARYITEKGRNAACLELLPPGTVVVSTRAPVGSLGLIEVRATTNQGCKAIKVSSDKAVSRFLFYLLHVAVPFLNSIAQGATFVELSGFQLKNLRICCPDKETQTRISNWLDLEMKRFDSLESKLNREIVLLEEYRSSLIYHAVTGRIDLRNIVESAKPKAGGPYELTRSKF